MTADESRLPQGMHVIRAGPRGAPPLVLIHGSGASGASWGPMTALLAERHHVVRVDLPGCGKSPAAASYEVPVQAGRVAALLDELGLRQAAVAGHSSGGYVATALAEQRPDLVGSLALISTGPALDALLPEPFVLRALLGPPFGPLLWTLRSDAMVRKGIRATTARPVEVADELVAGVQGISYRTFRKVLRANGAYIAERSVPERLAALQVPAGVLVLFGGADPRWDPASARRYEVVPRTRIELLPGVGHVPLLEAPEATCELLLAFTATGSGIPPAAP
ncbi:alpha/beta hydrolase [Streptomyces sp. YC504]|uniref:Alpha/beta hydrolase n=1 Tax=Streptomyces mesophilus TaxID=1775132 RepID=A0A6G4XJZ7_9ACTN|nr:alpha/beta hydrolase [Streptomyces mesophilus]NGO77738.1 alpha/beta hydrolase [Streptomyces mesophilus]